MKEIPKTLIHKSFALITEITHHYGPDQAHKAWEGLCDAMPNGEELKMEIFRIMLTGNIPAEQIVFKSWDPESGVTRRSKIRAIKWVRGAVSIGHLEAKELVEDIDTSLGPQVKMPMYNIPKSKFKDYNNEDTHPNYDLWKVEAADLGLDIEFI